MEYNSAGQSNESNGIENSEIDVDIKIEAVEEPSNSFRCPQCPLIFHCLLTLDNHIRFHTKEHPFECKSCHKSFPSSKGLRSHYKGSGGCSENLITSEVKSTKDFECGICQKVLSSHYALVRHQRLHTGERPYICIECEEGFIDIGDLSRHMRRHSGKTKLQCQICNKICVSEKRLTDHMFSHNGKKKYQCPTCDKLCKCKSHLDEHMRIHTGEKPFICSFCNVSYRFKSQLREHHLNKHSDDSEGIHNEGEKRKNKAPVGKVKCNVCDAVVSRSSIRHHRKLHQEKLHKCDMCYKSYTSNCRLVIHKRSHTGERPFKCKVCDKGLTTKDGLNRHMILHGNKKDHKCPFCDREFYYLSNLNQHILTHRDSSTSESLTCPRCNKSFGRKSLLKTHLSKPCGTLLFSSQELPSANSATLNNNFDMSCETLSSDINNSSSVNKNTDIPEEAKVNKVEVVEPLQSKTSVVVVGVPALVSDQTYYFAKEEFVYPNVTMSSPIVSNINESKSNIEIVKNIPTSKMEAEQINTSETLDVPVWKNCQTPNSQTTTVYHRYANKNIEIQHPDDMILTADDLSNLMTLAGVSSETEAVSSGTEANSNSSTDLKKTSEVVIVTFDSLSDTGNYESKAKVGTEHVSLDSVCSPSVVNQDCESDLLAPVLTSACLSSVKDEISKPNDVKESVNYLNCLHCEETFQFHYSLQEHCSKHHPDQDIYKCFDCDETFDCITSQMKHSRVHNGNSCIQCKICNRMFSHPQKLHQHMAKHNGLRIKKFKCTECDRSFIDSTHLREHMMVHSGKKPYSCPTCNQQFVRIREMQVHMRIHSGELPFKCTKCDKAFRASNYLRAHMYTHEDVKPFQCTECDKGYAKRSKLRLHMMNHTGTKPFKCKEEGCGKSYSEKRDFIHHSMVHRGEKPHKCRVCNKAFTIKGNMLQHERIHNKL